MGKRVVATMVTWGDRTDEAVYLAHRGLFDSVRPIHGGNVRADGTWIERAYRIDAPFSQALPALAREASQSYCPAIAGYDHAEWSALLDNPRAWQGAVDGLLALIDSRFDKPWDGCLFAFEGTELEQQDRATELISMLADAVRAEGLPAWMNVMGREGDTGLSYDGTYALDYRALNRVVDGFTYGIAGYWKPLPRSIGPFWWANGCLGYAVDDCRIPARKITVNLGGWSRLMPPSGGTSGTLYFYDDALELVGDAPIRWMEQNDNGIIREHYARLEDGSTMWLNDGRWVRERLPLLDRRGIESVSFFRPAMAAPDTWRTIADWKRPRESRPADRFYQSPNWCA